MGRAACRAMVAAAALICVTSRAASAHHSAAPVFDLSSEKTVTGVVNRVEWTNPHIWVWLDGPNASGQVEALWVEGMGPGDLGRRGTTKTWPGNGAESTVTLL